jgi:hypothetical protein
MKSLIRIPFFAGVNFVGKQLVRVTLISTITLLLSCTHPEYKKCEVQTSDASLKVYNDILNEVLVKDTYLHYLGKEAEPIFTRSTNHEADSANIKDDVIELHNKLFGDTSRFCTLYLDAQMRPEFKPWAEEEKETAKFNQEIVKMIRSVGLDGQRCVDSLNTVQTQYPAKAFHSCIAKLKPIQEQKTDKSLCVIGSIAFSKFVLNNTGDKGLLYYDFKCGELCGYGALLTIKKLNGNWVIDQSRMLWVS